MEPSFRERVYKQQSYKSPKNYYKYRRLNTPMLYSMPRNPILMIKAPGLNSYNPLVVTLHVEHLRRNPFLIGTAPYIKTSKSLGEPL